jgi:hypothetical protein
MDVLSEYFQWPNSILGAIIQGIQFSRLHGEVVTIVDIDFQLSLRFGSCPNWIALSRQWSRGMELKVYCNISSVLICTVNVSLYCGTEIGEVGLAGAASAVCNSDLSCSSVPLH